MGCHKILTEPFFVGREKELSELQKHLKDALVGKGSSIIISGEAGSGKTRLAQEFIGTAKSNGFLVLSGWGLGNACIPYFPFIEAFNSSSSQLGLSQDKGASALFFETDSAFEPLTSEFRKDQTYQSVARRLLSLAANRPTVLFIDDLHWADSASLSLIHYISKIVPSERMMVLATYRTEEVDYSPDGVSRPLKQTLRLMGREGLFKEIRLSGLTTKEMTAIAQNMLGGHLADALIDKLSAETQGNALFLVELLRMLYSLNLLHLENGKWSGNELENFEIPEKFKDVILRRIDSLNENERALLDLASVLGVRFDAKVLSVVLKKDIIDTLRSLNIIIRKSWLIKSEASGFVFSHSKIQEMILDSIPSELKRAYFLRIARELEISGNSDTEELAAYYQQGGDVGKAVVFSLEAGKHALNNFNASEASKYFEYVVSNKDILNAQEQKVAIEGLGDAFYSLGKFGDAIRTYRLLIDGAAKSIPSRVLRKTMDAAFFQGDIVLLEDLIKLSKESLNQDRIERGRILHNIARLNGLIGKSAEALAEIEEALQIFEEECLIWDTAWISVVAGFRSVELGKIENGLAASLRAIAIFDEIGDYRCEMEACNIAAGTFGLCGLFGEALALLSRAKELDKNKKIGDNVKLSLAYAFSGNIKEDTGQLNSALEDSKIAYTFARYSDSAMVQAAVLSNLTREYSLKGDLALAKEYYNRLIALPDKVLSGPYIRDGIFNVQGIYFAAQDKFKEAEQFFSKSFEWAKLFGNPTVLANLKTNYAWFLDRREKIREAESQRIMAQKIYREATKRFEDPNIQIKTMIPSKVSQGQDFQIRLDIINTSRVKGNLEQIENLIPDEVEVLELSKNIANKDGLITFFSKEVLPFETKTITINLKTTITGFFSFQPSAVFSDRSGRTKRFKALGKNLQVLERSEELTSTSQYGIPISFECVGCEAVVKYLASAFREDYERKKRSKEECGWRTLMDIINKSGASKRNIYGSANRKGRIISELEKNLLIESRFFSGERGRGGKILKVRLVPRFFIDSPL